MRIASASTSTRTGSSGASLGKTNGTTTRDSTRMSRTVGDSLAVAMVGTSSSAHRRRAEVTDSRDTVMSQTAVALIVLAPTATSAGTGGTVRQDGNDEGQRRQMQFIGEPRTTRDWAKISYVAHGQQQMYSVTSLPCRQPKDTDDMVTTRSNEASASPIRNDQQLELLQENMQGKEDKTESTHTTQRGTSGEQAR